MTALYIIGAILAMLMLILLSSARLCVKYDDDFKLSLRFWFIKINLYPQEKKDKKKKSKKDGNDNKTDSGNEKLKKSVDKKGYADTFVLIKNSLSELLKSLGTLVSHIRIKPLKLKLIMAGKDAADLAIEYGRLCAVFYPFLAYLCEIMTVNNKNIYIGVDYLKQDYELKLDLTVKIRVIFMLSFAVKALFSLIKTKVKQIMEQNKITTNNTERNVIK